MPRPAKKGKTANQSEPSRQASDSEFINIPSYDSDGNSPSPQPRGTTPLNPSNPAPNQSIPTPNQSNPSIQGGTRTPDIVRFFETGPDPQGVNKRFCKQCKSAGATYAHSYALTTSTSTVRGHLAKYHRDEYMAGVEEGKWVNLLPDAPRNAPAADTDHLAFTQTAFMECLVDFIVASDQPLNIVECPEFHRLLLLLRPQLTENGIPHRTKIRGLIIQAWQKWFKSLARRLEQSVGKLSCTADMWSDQSQQGYFAITVHWIEKVEVALALESAILGFHHIHGSHTGKALAETALALLDRAGVTTKVGHWTLDNADVNTTFLAELNRLFAIREIPQFDEKDVRIRCFPHVINRCSQAVINSFTDIELVDSEDDYVPLDPSSNPNAQTYNDAAARDPISLCRGLVTAIRKSGKRRNAFDDYLRKGKERGWHTVEPLQLLRDVKTRWDSVYFMITRVKQMKPAISGFLAQMENADLAKFNMSEQEWQVLDDFIDILKIPHAVQQSLCGGDQCPVLSLAIPAFEVFMSAWEKLIQNKPHLTDWINAGLDVAVKYYVRMDDTKAYIISMFINPATRMTWIKDNWDRDYFNNAVTTVKNMMTEYRAQLRSEAQVPAASSQSYPTSNRILTGMEGLLEEFDLGGHMAIRGPGSNPQQQSVEQEYQSYVSTVCLPWGSPVLRFWELSATTYPTIFAIAMDYIPIQATAVPCERAFSSSAETDTKKRNRIAPALMEALQMLKYALKKRRLKFTEGWSIDERELVDNRDGEKQDVLGTLLVEKDGDIIDRILMMLIDDDEVDANTQADAML